MMKLLDNVYWKLLETMIGKRAVMTNMKFTGQIRIANEDPVYVGSRCFPVTGHLTINIGIVVLLTSLEFF